MLPFNDKNFHRCPLPSATTSCFVFSWGGGYSSTSSPSACCGSALISSKVPPQCKGKEGGGDGAGVILGIDEAGRGPVLGPMTYGAAYWSCADDKEVSAMGFDDSKALTAAQREGLFGRIDKVF